MKYGAVPVVFKRMGFTVTHERLDESSGFNLEEGFELRMSCLTTHLFNSHNHHCRPYAPERFQQGQFFFCLTSDLCKNLSCKCI